MAHHLDGTECTKENIEDCAYYQQAQREYEAMAKGVHYRMVEGLRVPPLKPGKFMPIDVPESLICQEQTCRHYTSLHHPEGGTGCQVEGCECNRCDASQPPLKPGKIQVLGEPNADLKYPYHADASLCMSWGRQCDQPMHFASKSAIIEWQQSLEPTAFQQGVAQAAAEEQRDGNVGAENCAHFECTGEQLCMHGPQAERDMRDGNVGELIDGRIDVYGDPVTGFIRHAQVWSGILGHEVQPWQVALCMIGYKLVRTGITPDYSDNSDDVDGYLDIFRQLIGEDMVHARDTAEYVAKGGQGARP